MSRKKLNFYASTPLGSFTATYIKAPAWSRLPRDGTRILRAVDLALLSNVGFDSVFALVAARFASQLLE